MKKNILLFLSTILLLASCSKESTDTTPSSIDLFHEEYYSVNILPTLNNFKAEISKQIELTETFKTNTTQENFNALQEQWLKSASSFSKTRVYNVVDVKSLYFDIIIYNFPVNTNLIEDNIADKTTFDTDYISNSSTVSKGLAGMEYLLFDDEGAKNSLTLLQEDTYRVDYLLAITKENLRQINLLINYWEQGYKETFKNYKNLSCVENARCLAFNQLINIIDIIRVTKIGKPAGLEKSPNTDLSILEAYRSRSSLKLIKSSLEEVQKAYATSSVNFANIVDEIAGSSEISTEIDNSFNTVFNNIDAIDGDLYTAISNGDKSVATLHTSLATLLQYFSVDAASTLSVNVLPTDNDGD
ncbi:imelysin family protein [Polaribacter sp. Q13]|uniref:imelysin family protein n=1 Tax=Polaribacter sp. Q13 TaxID=2806551 RepID=UPI00193C4E1B|nr:imelysin family protein [Polaribacter sp. Q13]QVY65882.1 imelysin family protein [Polaribacter sp. Q13]